MKVLLLAFALFVGLVAVVPFKHWGVSAWIAIVVATAATDYLGAMVTKGCCTEFPKGTTTVGELARWIMSHKADLANVTTQGWTREQVAMRVREIVIDVLCCEANYREDARFVEDLGLR